MSSPIRSSKTPFTLKKQEIVSIGRTSVSLYPKVEGSWSDAEKSMAFQQIKAALAQADLDQRARILALADRLDLMTTAESILADWERRLNRHWADFTFLTILSWHNTAGAPIDDTTTAADASILKPVQDGAVADCRSAGVKFVRVQLELDYADLAVPRVGAGPAPLLRGEYYIQLPQGSRDVTNAAGNVRRLSTFLGVADLRTLSVDEVQRDILHQTHQDGPYDLLAPSFNLTSCRTDSQTVYGELKSLVVRLASETIHDTLFRVLVPGYSIEPHNVLDHIWQSYVDADNKAVTLSAQAYYTTFLNAIRPFYDLEEYPIDLAGIFQDHINPSLQKGFRTHYPLYGQTRSRTAITQRNILTDMLTALIKAENDISNIKDIIRGEQGGGEQFHSATAQSNPSVAEKTLRKYGDDTTKVSRDSDGSARMECFGCGSTQHPWSRMVDGKYVVVCPSADQPGIRAKAELEIQKYTQRRRRNLRNNKKKRNLNTVNWADIPAKRQAVILEQQRAGGTVSVPPGGGSSVASSITGTTNLSVVRRSNVTLHQDVVVLSANQCSNKPTIPIAIHSPMPHLTLQTGSAKEEKDCPGLRCMLDSASLSTANFHYMEAVVRQYPHILKAIYLPEDYASIVLSGIVTSSDAAPITTELSVGFEIHLPYLTKDGNETSLLVAAGPDVAVNLILGLPFIKATGMIADFVDNVCQAKHLLCDPFPIDFRRATKSIPAVEGRESAAHSAEFREVHQALGSLRAFFARSSSPTSIAPRDSIGEFGSINPTTVSFKTRWVPPSAYSTNDYPLQVLGDHGYL